MKQTVRVSIGGTLFHLDEDAYRLMESYLSALHHHFGHSPDAQEVIADIEGRAAELLQGLRGRAEAISQGMVEAMIGTLGRPGQIADGEPPDGQPGGPRARGRGASGRRRLFRDPHDVRVAGVCSGLAAYFGVSPVVPRALFVLLIFAKGLGLILYMALWVAMPRALTRRQRMAMRGEPFNLSNLERSLREECAGVRESISRWEGPGPALGRLLNFLSDLFLGLASALRAVGHFLRVLLGVVLLALGLLILVILTGGFFLHHLLPAQLVPSINGQPLPDFVRGTIDCAPFAWVHIPLYLVLAIPLALLVYLGVRMLFRMGRRATLPLALAATVWVLGVVTLAVVLLLQARSFTISQTLHHTEPLAIQAKTLHLTTVGLPIALDTTSTQEGCAEHVVIRPDGSSLQVLARPQVYFAPASGEAFALSMARTSRGASQGLARSNAQGLFLPLNTIDSTLVIAPYFSLPIGHRWRMQELAVTLLMPEGHRVRVDPSIRTILAADQPHASAWPDELAGRTWEMRGGRLVEVGPPAEGEGQQATAPRVGE